MPRKVKFAEPLIEQRLYDRTSSPNTETVGTTFITPLDQLEPPLSLVAQLDLAAKKLNARGPKSAVPSTDTAALGPTITTNAPGQKARSPKSPVATTSKAQASPDEAALKTLKSVKSAFAKQQMTKEGKKKAG